MKTSKKGISLIVLVITIIVMIVLAAAIILSLQSSGIIGRANEAKAKSDEKNMLQAANVAYGDYVLEKNLGETSQTPEQYVKNKLNGQFPEDELKSLNVLSDGTIQILPTIPTGFVVSQIEGENKISEGLVVYKLEENEDAEDINWTETDTETISGQTLLKVQTQRDQFVWIPVNDISEFEVEDWGKGITGNGFKDLSEPYSTASYTEEVEEYNKMKASVEKNGGFYIARYEAGKGENNTVVSKKGATVWNNVVWGTNMTTIGESGAVALARGVYPEAGNNNVKSTLCYGVEWDAVMNFMKDVPNPHVTGGKYIYDSTGMGWHDDNSNYEFYKTGTDVENGANRVKNIYDMAGNVWEWTMEAYSTERRVVRGGNFCCNGSAASASNRYAYYVPDDGGDEYGFRVALYLVVT